MAARFGMCDLMWQHHFEFLLLGYGAYATFAEFCKANLPDIPDQHIAQMVAGIDVLLFRPDAELRRLARLAIETGVDGAFVQGRSPARDRRRARRGAKPGTRWLAELEKVKDPWFNMATGDGLYHYYRSWLDDPSIPYAALIGHVAALRAGEQIERPTEEIRARARPPRRRVRRAARRGGPRADLQRPARAVAHRLPLRRGAQVLLRLLVLDPLVEQDPRVRSVARRARLPLDGEDVFQLSRYEVASALDELVLSWATGGEPLGPQHWPPIVARRKALLAKLGEWTPPPALGVTPEAVTDPMTIMLWGVTTERVREWARQQDGGLELNGAAASPGTRRGRRARRPLAGASSPTSATARSSSAAAPRRPGRRSSPRSRPPSPTSAASCPTPRSCAASTGCRPSSAPVAPRRRSRPGQLLRVDGTAGVVTSAVGNGAADG